MAPPKKDKSAKPAKTAKPAVVKESPAAAPLDEVDDDLELKKARGQTDSQKAIKAYHEGAFQTNDPVSGEPRDKNDAGF